MSSLHHQLQLQRASTGTVPSPGSQQRGSSAEAKHLVEELRGAGEALVILDALDEALDPESVVDELLLPLVSASTTGSTTTGCRVLIGTRPWWDVFPNWSSTPACVPGRC